MPTNRTNLMRLFVLLCMCTAGVFASPEDDQVGAYLKSHSMLALLEVQLEERIGSAKDNAERSQLVEELSDLYLEQLHAFDRDDPYRQIVLNRARLLTSRMGSVPMYELRIELLIELYSSVETKVELARLDLLETKQRSAVIVQLTNANHQLKALSSKLDPAVTHKERLGRRTTSNANLDEKPTLADLRRYRSLAHYYHAWTGYAIAVLKDQHVPTDVFESFGWLLGGEGEMARLSTMNETTLEFEHVAWSAIGVAMANAQSEDMLTARSWAKFVVESDHTQPDEKAAAEDRLLQILAMDRDWTSAYKWMLTIYSIRGEDDPMTTGDARFLAMKSLEAMRSTRVGKGGAIEAKRVAQLAIENLVQLGEIGHVLDLYKRFDSLPMMSDSFITNYAQALGELNRAERSGSDGMYASIASLFADALKSKDANRFPIERDDCTLKLAYSEIRSGRAKEAIKVCDQLIERSGNEEVVEEARWIRIAAIESLNMKRSKASSDALEHAVREYIVAYPATPRSAKLILRHAMQGTIDAQVAISTLSAISDADPIAIPARRTLVSLRYKRLQAMRFADQAANREVLDMIRWIVETQADEIVDLNDAKARMGTIRIGLDLSLRVSPAEVEFADRLLAHAMALMSYDNSFAKHRGEFVYRQVEIAMLDHRLNDAADLLSELETLDPKKADSARVLMFNDSIRAWQTRQNASNAQHVIDLGSKVLANQMPVFPNPMGLQVSTVAEMIAQAAEYLWTTRQDSGSHALALRLSLLVLDRGQPTEQGLRRTTRLTNHAKDYKHGLEAWLRLLAAYPSSDERWYEARYESLRVMKEVEFARALSAYGQYRVLHPSLGPAPWNEKIASLFGDPVPPSDGDAP